MQSPNLPVVDLDINATVFENTVLWLPELFNATLRAGSPMITGKTFRGCLLEGPAILQALGVEFDSCNLGESGGDIRNLLVRAVGPKVIGAIPFMNCRFHGCTFVSVGFTGDEAFIADFSQVPVGAAPPQPGGPR